MRRIWIGVVAFGLLWAGAFTATSANAAATPRAVASTMSAPSQSQQACVTLLGRQRDPATRANKVVAESCADTISQARQKVPEIAAQVNAVKKAHSSVTDANINSGATVASSLLLARAYKGRGYTGYFRELYGNSGPCDSTGYEFLMNGYASVANIAGGNCYWLEISTYPGHAHIYTYALPTADCYSNCNPGRYWDLRSTRDPA